MDAKARILDCALQELEATGLHGFSLRSVSAAARLTPMAIYRHYRNRDDLLRAVGEQAFAAWKARVERIKDKDPIAWLRRGSRAYAAFAVDEPAQFDACFVLNTGVERRYPEDFRAGKSPVIAIVVARLEAGQREGVVVAGDALEMAMTLWAEVHGLAMLHRCGRFAMARAAFLALCDRCVERILSGLKQKRARP